MAKIPSRKLIIKNLNLEILKMNLILELAIIIVAVFGVEAGNEGVGITVFN